jgi:NO-binding membrane sensor protein with MHYT domain
VRYDPVLTLLSMIIAIVACGIGLFMVGGDRPSRTRILIGGAITGGGVAAMHYTGMAAMRVAGTITYDPGLVAASVIIAVVAATAALLFTIAARRPGHIVGAALIMAVAVCGMHYTAMAAMRVELSDSFGAVSGVSSLLLIIPMTLITSAGLLGMALSGLQAMTAEEFSVPATAAGAHARPYHVLSPR